MPIRNRMVALIVSVGMLLLIIELVRRRKLREEYSWLWLLTVSTILLLTGLVRSVEVDYLTDWSDGTFFHDFHAGFFILDLYQPPFFRGDFKTDEPEYRTGATIRLSGVRIERSERAFSLVKGRSEGE